MKKAFIFIFVSTLIVSCAPDPIDPVGLEPAFNCSIEVSIESCPTANCQNPIDVVNKKVEIYEDYYSMMQGMDPIHVDSTNENGWVKFYDFGCHLPFALKVDLGINGTYILERANFITTNEIVDINILPNFYYNNAQWPELIVRHVSLDFLAVGQWSRYNYFEVDGELSFDASNHYLGPSLDISVNRQLDGQSFLVGEHLTNLNPTYFPDLPNSTNQFYTESTWRIEGDTLYVSNQSPTNNIVSLIWSITEDEGTTQGEYAIPFKKIESDNYLDIDDTFVAPNPIWEEVGFCSDFQTQDYLFENLLVELRDYSLVEEDGSIKCLIFNAHDGLVRNIRFYKEGQAFTAGFDLIVQ